MKNNISIELDDYNLNNDIGFKFVERRVLNGLTPVVRQVANALRSFYADASMNQAICSQYSAMSIQGETVGEKYRRITETVALSFSADKGMSSPGTNENTFVTSTVTQPGTARYNVQEHKFLNKLQLLEAFDKFHHINSGSIYEANHSSDKLEFVSPSLKLRAALQSFNVAETVGLLDDTNMLVAADVDSNNFGLDKFIIQGSFKNGSTVFISLSSADAFNASHPE